MKMFWRICLTALLVLQAVALPVHVFAQDAQHLGVGVSHHHAHNHAGDVNFDRSNEVQVDSNGAPSSPTLAIDSGEHTCISHCHVSAALLGEPKHLDSTSTRVVAASIDFDFDQHIPGSIERPKWSTARF
jgi:hypothetical protein